MVFYLHSFAKKVARAFLPVIPPCHPRETVELSDLTRLISRAVWQEITGVGAIMGENGVCFITKNGRGEQYASVDIIHGIHWGVDVIGVRCTARRGGVSDEQFHGVHLWPFTHPRRGFY